MPKAFEGGGVRARASGVGGSSSDPSTGKLYGVDLRLESEPGVVGVLLPLDSERGRERGTISLGGGRSMFTLNSRTKDSPLLILLFSSRWNTGPWPGVAGSWCSDAGCIEVSY